MSEQDFREVIKLGNELISIVMSAYNERLEWIRASVESILDQTYENIEFIIVLDNPENEGMRKLLEQYRSKDDRIKLIINEKNLGLVKSLNVALEHCSGRYIARMDADDISDVERLETQKTYLEDNLLDFVFSGVQVIDEENVPLYQTNIQEMDMRQTRKRLEKIHISYHPTWFLKTEIFKDLKGYREISYCEDYDFILRCLSKDFKIAKMKGYVLQYRVRKNGISKSFSLEQFLNTKGIIKLYRNKNLEDYSQLDQIMWNSKKIANDKEKNKFNFADGFYYEGVNHIKNGNTLLGVKSLIKSLFISKYYLLRNIDVLKYKISNYQTRKMNVL